MQFNFDHFVVKDLDTMETLFFGNSEKGLFHLHSDEEAFYGERDSTNTWYGRLGHPSECVFKVMSTELMMKNEKLKVGLCSKSWALLSILMNDQNWIIY